MIKIGYIILAHEKPSQLLRLIKRLEGNSNPIFLHVDKRVDLRHFSNGKLDEIKNLYYLGRYKCYWGAIGLVRATMAGINAALDLKCDYIVLLSGSDYPIKSNAGIQKFLDTHYGKSFFTHYKIPAPYWLPGKEINRIKKHYFHLNGKLFEYPIPPGQTSLSRKALNSILSLFLPEERVFPENIVPYGGDQWFCLTNQVGQGLINFYKSHPDVMRFLQFALIPDEIFLQTGIFNSSPELIDSVANDTITLVNWKNRNSSSPAYFETEDFDLLFNSQKLFARKFDQDKTPELLNRIDEQLLMA